MPGDLLGQVPVLRRVALGDAGAEDGDGPPSSVEGSPVGGGVDAAGQSRNDGHVTLGKHPRHPLRSAQPRLGCLPGADHSHRSDVLVPLLATDEEKRRQVRHQPEVGRVLGIEHRYQCCPDRFGGRDLSVDASEQLIGLADPGFEYRERALGSGAFLPDRSVPEGVETLGAWVRIPFLVGFENVSRIHMMASDPDEWVVLC
jgi:hypothetical protein